jgi:flagellin
VSKCPAAGTNNKELIMAAIINTNVNSLNSQRQLTRSQGDLSTALQRLSSGLRINSAKDDAAGLAISDRFTSQIRGLDQARRNANDGISLAQTAEGSLSSMGDMLQRIRELAVQSANATNSASDRAALQNEVSNLTAELNRTAQTTQFNGRNLLDGSFTFAQFQVGANANQTITATSQNFQTSAYGSYRMGALVQAADTTNVNAGDLVKGSTGTNVTTTFNTTSFATGRTGTTFDVNGALGSSTITYVAGDSAKTVAGLVNAKQAETGVTATAITEIRSLSWTANSSYSISVTSDNATAVKVAFTTGSAINADGLSSAVNAFNDVSSKTGVTARVNTAGTEILLTNSSGNNITLANAASGSTSFNLASTSGANGATASGAIATGATGYVSGQLGLDSDKTFNVSGATVGNTTNGVSWFSAATGASQQQTVQYADVSNVDAANRTIALIDGALQNVATQRARYGALQNRFESTVKSLMTASENMSASRSRIQDADFAAETANLTRAQILQQAGIAMLSQANALPNQVLSLLK